MAGYNKDWWTSRTLWVNFFAFVGLAAQTMYGFLFSAEVQAYIITGFNVILRLITKKGLE
uniref:Uncharacterized protein n=1 Tax=viral metagenome TaxID=1070528 RepID=A0A6M3X4E9_9ZZZZ